MTHRPSARQVVDLEVNGRPVRVNVAPDTPLLWVLRDELRLSGTRYGCGAGLCGSCTVHVDGRAVRSCIVSIGDVEGRRVTTIEGLARDGVLHAAQRAWLDVQVPQCGFCQPGQIMTVAAVARPDEPPPTESEVIEALESCLCRCGTYERIRAAVRAMLDGWPR